MSSGNPKHPRGIRVITSAIIRSSFDTAPSIGASIIPGAMHLLGDSAWWLPKWLDRILPDLDIEGASLGGGDHMLGNPSDVSKSSTSARTDASASAAVTTSP